LKRPIRWVIFIKIQGGYRYETPRLDPEAVGWQILFVMGIPLCRLYPLFCKLPVTWADPGSNFLYL